MSLKNMLDQVYEENLLSDLCPSDPKLHSKKYFQNKTLQTISSESIKIE